MKLIIAVILLLVGNASFSSECTLDELSLSKAGSVHYNLHVNHPSGSIGSSRNTISIRAFNIADGVYTFLKDCEIGAFKGEDDKYEMHYSTVNRPPNGSDRYAVYTGTKYEHHIRDQQMYASQGKTEFLKKIGEDISSMECWAMMSNYAGGNLDRNDNFWTYFCPKQGLLDFINSTIVENQFSSCTTSESGTVASNLDIHMPSLKYQTLLGVQNIWADLEYKGTNSARQHIWGLKDSGVNQ